MRKILGILAVSVLFAGCNITEYKVTWVTSPKNDNAFYYTLPDLSKIKIEKGTKIIGYIDEDSGIHLTINGTQIIDEPFNEDQKFTYQCGADGNMECSYKVENVMSGNANVEFTIKGNKQIEALFVDSDDVILGKLMLQEEAPTQKSMTSANTLGDALIKALFF